MFTGTFVAFMNATVDNVSGSTTDKIENIYKPQSNVNIIGQIPEIIFLSSTTDANVDNTLTTTSFVKITRVEKIDGEASILKYKLTGILTRPTTYAVVP